MPFDAGAGGGVAVGIVVVVVGSAVVGFLVRRVVLGARTTDHPRAGAEGVTVSDLLYPVRTLASLVLAFVVVSVYGAFADTDRQATTEAGAVLSMSEDALLLTPAARQDVLGRLQCYARSVAGPDFDSQARDGAPSAVTDAAADRISTALGRAAADPADGVAIGAMLGDNSTRVQARLQRFQDGLPSVPGVVWVLLLLTMAVMLGGLAALAHPGVGVPIQVAVLAGTALVFGLTLLVVHDLDRPYSGLARVEPTAMLDVERRIATLPGDPVPAPCDERGIAR